MMRHMSRALQDLGLRPVLLIVLVCSVSAADRIDSSQPQPTTQCGRTCASQHVEAVPLRPFPIFRGERRAGDDDGARPVRVQVEAGPLRVALRLDLNPCGLVPIDGIQ